MSGVVIVDDDVLIRGLLTEWLTVAGYGVTAVASDGAKTDMAPDLVIVDVYMPRHLGVDRLKSTRESYPGVPIIAISGQFRCGVGCAGAAARALGVDGVVAKPFGREELLDAVRSVIGRPVVGTD